jgi:FolB domain-containing protein
VNTMDTMTITDLELSLRIGITDAERATPQRILLSVTYRVESCRIAEKDDVLLGLDYAEIIAALRTLSAVERGTVERLAEDTASLLLQKFRMKSVVVCVKKFPFPDAKEISLTIERHA